MRFFLIFLLASSLFSCKKQTIAVDCGVENCKAPRRCEFNECKCQDGSKFVGGFCARPNTFGYIAYLPETDFLDTFILQIPPAVSQPGYGNHFAMATQNRLLSWTGFLGGFLSLPDRDSIYLTMFSMPSTMAKLDSMDGKKFFMDFSGTVKSNNRDTLYARIRWIGLASVTDMRPPIDFKMILIK